MNRLEALKIAKIAYTEMNDVVENFVEQRFKPNKEE